MSVLFMVKRRYFEAIRDGTKTVEFREASDPAWADIRGAEIKEFPKVVE